MAAMQSKPKLKKMIPKKSTRAAPSNPSLDSPTLAKKDDIHTPVKPTLEDNQKEKQAPEGSAKTKPKGKEVGDGPTPPTEKTEAKNAEK